MPVSWQNIAGIGSARPPNTFPTRFGGDWFEDDERFQRLLDDLLVGEEIITGVRRALLPLTLEEVLT